MDIYNRKRAAAIAAAAAEADSMPELSGRSHYYVVSYDLGSKGVPYQYHTWYTPKAKLVAAESQKQAKEIFRDWYGYVRGEKKYPYHIEAKKLK